MGERYTTRNGPSTGLISSPLRSRLLPHPEADQALLGRNLEGIQGVGDGVSLSRLLVVSRLITRGTFFVLTFRPGFWPPTSEPTQSPVTLPSPAARANRYSSWWVDGPLPRVQHGPPESVLPRPEGRPHETGNPLDAEVHRRAVAARPRWGLFPHTLEPLHASKIPMQDALSPGHGRPPHRKRAWESGRPWPLVPSPTASAPASPRRE
jgi:hypothetical protein